MQVPDYRDSSRERAIYWVARAAWIYAILSVPAILIGIVSSPYLTLDCSYLVAVCILILPSIFGIILSLWSRSGVENHEDNSFIRNTKRESGWGLIANGVLLACALLSILALRGRAADLQENRDLSAMGRSGLRATHIVRGCIRYAQEFNGKWPPSVRVLLESNLINPIDIAAQPNDSAILERVAHGDMMVSDAQLEHATGFRYLGNESGIHAKQGDHHKDSIALFSFAKPVRGRIAAAWSDGMSDEIDPEDLDKPLPE